VTGTVRDCPDAAVTHSTLPRPAQPHIPHRE
jgi:hypothetical protein